MKASLERILKKPVGKERKEAPRGDKVIKRNDKSRLRRKSILKRGTAGFENEKERDCWSLHTDAHRWRGAQALTDSVQGAGHAGLPVLCSMT